MTRHPPAPRTAFRSFHPVQTRWQDNDQYGHINNVTYLEYMDTVICLWQIEQGMDMSGESAVRYLTVESGCRYHAEARFPDVLTAGLRVGTLGNSSMRFEVALFREGEETACVEGHFVLVAVDPETRPMRIPDRERAILETILV
ncbi:acyl-CoA thioesterase [Salipiger sp. P9]|uniref:acyl-CoA thioesterase n=1 Tax=Salipiger pentaromativorans TaxID=2943193 RepID=UPI0021584994|nr:thioesterase family protein [Salipiger pentaromativorans]MCR8547894.1 acyl-CoA thioesterase [Salipiger pentaromativorans]